MTFSFFWIFFLAFFFLHIGYVNAAEKSVKKERN